MIEKTRAEVLREHIRANGPIGPADLSRLAGMKYAHVWGTCNPMVRKGLLLCDEKGRYSMGREPSIRVVRSTVPYRERERLRAQGRAAQRKADRQAMKLAAPVQSKEVLQRDYDQRQRVEALQAVHNRENGLRAVVPQRPHAETVEEWMARTGKTPQRLGNGEVSKASRFERLQVRA